MPEINATRPRGRPRTVSRSAMASAAMDLFRRVGFEATTMDDIAVAAGVSRRTLFRYFPSKNDIVWGDFELVLDRLRADLAAGDPEAPMIRTLAGAVVSSNRYDPGQLPELRHRLMLITTVPALQAHSMLRYAAWRAVVAEYAAERLGQRPDDLAPLALAEVALGTAMAAFTHWIHDPGSDLEANLEHGFRLLVEGYDGPALHA